MGEVFSNIVNTILPIFMVVGVTVAVDRVVKPDPRGLSQLVIYLFSPFLVLNGIATTELKGGEVGQIVGFAIVLCLIMAGLSWGTARLAGFDRKLESAFMLTVVLLNAGNFGIPLNRFAFGAAGEQRAVIFFVGTVLVSNTVGVFLASRGDVSTRRALLNVLTVPLPYAALLGLMLNMGDLTMPKPMGRAVGFLAQAANPAMLTVLGLQLSRASVTAQARPITMACGLRLIVSPVIAVLLTVVFGLSGLTRQVAIVQAGMPSAVMGGVLATEFGSDARYVTSTILISTLASMVTLSVVLSLV
jgi:predicted permease